MKMGLWLGSESFFASRATWLSWRHPSMEGTARTLEEAARSMRRQSQLKQKSPSKCMRGSSRPGERATRRATAAATGSAPVKEATPPPCWRAPCMGAGAAFTTPTKPRTTTVAHKETRFQVSNVLKVCHLQVCWCLNALLPAQGAKGLANFLVGEQ